MIQDYKELIDALQWLGRNNLDLIEDLAHNYLNDRNLKNRDSFTLTDLIEWLKNNDYLNYNLCFYDSNGPILASFEIQWRDKNND